MFLKKGTTYVLLILLLFVPSSLLVLIFQKLIYGDIHYLLSAFVFSLLLLVTILFNRIKPHTEKAVEQFLFKDRYDYRETLGKVQQSHGYDPRFTISVKENHRDNHPNYGC